MAKIRKKIPQSIVDELLYKSKHICNICNISRKAVHVHHIDENPSNNTNNNLIVLCLDCHSAVTNQGLGKKYTEGELLLYRKNWEEKIHGKLEEHENPSTSYNISPKTVKQDIRQSEHSKEKPRWDVFISHASSDKEPVATPLAKKLELMGLSVWYDQFTLKWGDSLTNSIDEGLKNSLFGIVILSKAFFEKEWTKKELGGLMNLASRHGENKILPLRYGLTAEQVADYSPILSDILSRSWDEGLDSLSSGILEIVKEKKGTSTSKSSERKRTTEVLTNRKFIKNHYRIPPEPFLKISLDNTNYFSGNEIIARISFLGISKGESIVIETYNSSQKVIDMKRYKAPSKKGYFDIKLFTKTDLLETGEYSVVVSTQFGPSGTNSFIYRTKRSYPN